MVLGWGGLGGCIGEDSTNVGGLARAGLRPAATLKALGRGGRVSRPAGGRAGRRAVGAGLPANSLKCVGERGKEERISSQQPRHLVEGPSEDTDQITNTQPGQLGQGQCAGRTPGAGTSADNCGGSCPPGWPLRHHLALGPQPALSAWGLTPALGGS